MGYRKLYNGAVPRTLWGDKMKSDNAKKAKHEGAVTPTTMYESET